MVRSLKERLRARFNVSVAETGLHDVHDRAELTAALVASDGQRAETVVGQINHFVDENGRALVVRRTREEH